MAVSDAAKAGAVLFVGVVQFGILMVVSEALSPTYSVGSNYISDLGKLFPNSAGLYNTSIILLGISVIVTSLFIHKAFKWIPGTVIVAVAGLGQIGIGVFPEGSPFALHSIFSLIVFVAIGLSAILLSRWQKPPMKYMSVLLGLMTLVFLVLYAFDSGSSWGSLLGIGPGGLERMVVYPSLFWGVGFGGYLMSFPGK